MTSLIEVARAEVAQRNAEYDADCAQWAEEGLAPHYCIHGTNLWVDYDNICGGCEDPLTDEQIAQQIADTRQYQCDAFIAATVALNAVTILPRDKRAEYILGMTDDIKETLTLWHTLPADRV